MLNMVVLMGRLTHTPEVKISKNAGISVLRFCLAVERPRTTDGEKQTDFIDCVAWRNTAEFIEKYFKKGDPIIAEGRTETRQYEDKQGNNRKAVEVIVRNVNFCAFRREENKEIDEEKTSDKDLQELLEDGDLPF